MGVYDNVRCRYPLPDPEAQPLTFQTKSMPAPYLEDYEITEDGRLLHLAYDLRCDADAESPADSSRVRENERWEEVECRGQLELHTIGDDSDGNPRWYWYLFWFKEGRVADLQHGQGHGQSM